MEKEVLGHSTWILESELADPSVLYVKFVGALLTAAEHTDRELSAHVLAHTPVDNGQIIVKLG